MPGPDPKPGRRPRVQLRIIDPKAIHWAKVRWSHCAACGKHGGNGHHVLPKDRFGDDVEGNIVVLCGSGTTGCHGAHHGSPYLHDAWGPGITANLPERRDADWVNQRVGETIRRERPDVIAYILEKLGDRAGRNFLSDTYYLDLPYE